MHHPSRVLLLFAILFVAMQAVGGTDSQHETKEKPGSASRPGPSIANPDDANNDREQFAILKSLAGDWARIDTEDRPLSETFVRYRVIAGGRAVTEELGVGAADLVLTVYHMDGPHLRLTRFGPTGGQPRMRCAKPEQPSEIRFDFVDATSLADANSDHIHELALRFVRNGRLRIHWVLHRNRVPVRTFDFLIARKPGPVDQK